MKKQWLLHNNSPYVSAYVNLMFKIVPKKGHAPPPIVRKRFLSEVPHRPPRMPLCYSGPGRVQIIRNNNFHKTATKKKLGEEQALCWYNFKHC